MTTLPAIGTFESAPLGQPGGAALAKNALDEMLAVLHQIPGTNPASSYKIDSGGSLATNHPTVPVAVAPDVAHLLVDTAPGQTEDNLARIPLPTGAPRWLLVQPAVSGHTVVILSGMGGDGEIVLSTAGASRKFKLTNLFSGILLYRSGSAWKEWLRSYGSDQWGASGGVKWRWGHNGILRQSGSITTEAAADKIVTFAKPFLSNDYEVGAMMAITAASPTPSAGRLLVGWGKTTTQFRIKANTHDGTQSAVDVDWWAEGYAE